VIEAARYYLRLLVSRQAVLAPVLFYLALVALDYSSPGGPPRLAEPHLQAGAITAVALMPATAWLTRLVATSESAPFAEVTLVSLGGSRRRQVARSAAVLVIAAGLTGAAMLWGRVADPAPYHAATVIELLGMHLAEACAGAGIGVLIAPPLRTRGRYRGGGRHRAHPGVPGRALAAPAEPGAAGRVPPCRTCPGAAAARHGPGRRPGAGLRRRRYVAGRRPPSRLTGCAQPRPVTGCNRCGIAAVAHWLPK